MLAAIDAGRSRAKALRLLHLGILVCAGAGWVSAENPIRGFDEAGAAAQRELERDILATPQPANVREAIRILSEEPHATGSAASYAVAAYIFEQFKRWGLAVERHEFRGLMPVPRERHLQLLAPEKYVAELSEPALSEDKDSTDAGGLPTFNAYSPDGDVTGQVVYVHYGLPEDYDRLSELGVDVDGKIVLARYGRSFRGIKPRLAAERGAIGCLIYSDPADDGYFQGDAYPDGPFRPRLGVQRGSAMDLPVRPGDPLTPGYGEGGGPVLAIEDAETLPAIPTLPISWGEAEPILRNLGGPVAPESWRGAVPVTYHLGAGPAEVRLRVAFDWERLRGENVIAKIEGSEYPDEWVMYGNHHDAWVNGATDPVSGMAALLETARTLAERVKAGWKPKRTIVFAAWDGEEYGLLGSTEYGEELAAELREKAVVYFNTDSNSQGPLGMAGSHTLERFVNEVAAAVPDPRTGRSLLEEARDKALEEASPERKTRLDSRKDLPIGALGSGSDYTVFIDHLGVASTNVAFRGDTAGVYHSIYDSFDWYRRFGDPEFLYGKALAQFHAVAIARMADAEVIPLHPAGLTTTLGVYLDELEELAAEKQIELPDLRGALEKAEKAAEAYEKAYERAASGGFQGDVAELNGVLRGLEQTLLADDGLPKRPWFRHLVYAPGYDLGYGAKTVPGVREAIEAGDGELARAEAERFRAALGRFAAEVARAREMLGRL